MTHQHDARPAARGSGVALALADGTTLLALSAAGCRLLARAVLAALAGRDDAEAFWLAARNDPAVAAWATAGSAADQPVDRIERLSSSLVVAAASHADSPATQIGGRCPDAELLLDAVAAGRAHADLLHRFEERLAEARLAAVRELAYGAGHEINNPLANIAARAQALLRDERQPERRRRLATIVDQAFRARDMIGGLMLFARPPRPEPDETTVDDLLRPVLAGLASQAEQRGIRLHYVPTSQRLPLFVDPTQVGEAIRMLAVNALEAVAEGGRVEFAGEGATAGPRARITVTDDGPGMDPETAATAGDPFFSGREAGRGIGLGLPKARRLIESSGGSLEIESRPGKGTRCILDLPAARSA
ncbi:MAG: HAMP domain-containing sensor histidine kinase [Planctomycetota bacterium]|nr:HAMP domain-containing sensor histidine kinase [Planctomycetota bacterium]MDA1202216.1 HAMP domain-containing sensor histidine kinase [Planctomycetota bacterium]